MPARYAVTREIAFDMFGFLPETVRASMLENIVTAKQFFDDGTESHHSDMRFTSEFRDTTKRWCDEKGDGRFCLYYNNVLFELKEDMALFLIEQPQGK